MDKRSFIQAATAVVFLGTTRAALAQPKPFKVGLILPLTGPQKSPVGRQIEAGVRLWIAQHGDTVAGRKVELVVRDDASQPDMSRRAAQELVVTEKVDVLAGFALTPSALAVAPIATQSQTPQVVMCAASSSITEASPYIVRTSFTLPQVSVALADWAPKNGINTVVSLVSDYGPGLDGEKFFKERFTGNGGKVLDAIRVPLRNPDSSPFLQKVRDLKPDALFVFVPSGVGTALLKQFLERGMDKLGIRLMATGDMTDDDQLNDMGDGALGVVTSYHYSADHASAANRKFSEDFRKANDGLRPNAMAVSGFDGMRVIYEALKKTGGRGGAALVDAMKGQAFESPRGPISIDAQTRDIVQNIYLRRVERKGGQLYNVEFDVIKDMKDPGKAK